VAQPPKVDNDLYVRDYSKCVLCYKCVEACGTDAQHTFAIAVAGRGFGARIATEYETPLPDSACVYCGNCIGVCPTGALMFSSEHAMREAGTWDESKQTVTDTVPTAASAARCSCTCRTTTSSGSRPRRITTSRAGTCASRAGSGGSSSRIDPRHREAVDGW
jgi:predicted molibdopterin-dependent oxidoreductase YjgC